MTKRRRLPSPAVWQRESHARILRFLWRSRAEWSGREIARQVGLSPPACHEALKRLYAQGLALFRRVSNVHLYRINPQSQLLRKVIVPIFDAEETLSGDLKTTIRRRLAGGASSRDILSIVMFGSMARGSAVAGSDLDLLVVLSCAKARKGLQPRLERLRKTLSERFAVPLSPYVQTLAEIREKHGRHLPLIQKILKEGKLLHGRELKELVL